MRAVIDLDGAVDLGNAGERHDLDVGDVVAGEAAVDRLQADGRDAPAHVVSTMTFVAVEAALVLPEASVAVAVKLWLPSVSARGDGSSSCRLRPRPRCRAKWRRHRP